jgi:hypothetical protein
VAHSVAIVVFIAVISMCIEAVVLLVWKSQGSGVGVISGNDVCTQQVSMYLELLDIFSVRFTPYAVTCEEINRRCFLLRVRLLCCLRCVRSVRTALLDSKGVTQTARRHTQLESRRWHVLAG